MATGSNCPVVQGGIQESREKITGIVRALKEEGVSPRISGNSGKFSVQSVLMYGLDEWVMKGLVMEVLENIHCILVTSIVERYP